MALTAEQKLEKEAAIQAEKRRTAELELERTKLEIEARREQAAREAAQGAGQGSGDGRRRQEAATNEREAADKAAREEADKALLVATHCCRRLKRKPALPKSWRCNRRSRSRCAYQRANDCRL